MAQCATAAGRTAPGTTIENRAPAPGTFSAQTRPPAAASRPRVIERPIPVPNDVCASRSPAVETLEQVIELARIEPGAVVRDRDMQSIRLDPGVHDDLPIGRRVLRRVLEQVRQRHRRQARVDFDLHLRVGIHAHARVPPAHAGRAPTAASTTSAAATHCRSMRIAAASMRAMSRMS